MASIDSQNNISSDINTARLDAKEREATSMSDKKIRSFNEVALSKGYNDLVRDNNRYLAQMSTVSADTWANVNIHDPNRMDIFYDRYAKFSDDVFNRLGFTPFRNNDAYYNDNTTTWENHQRVLFTMPGMIGNMMKQTWSFGDSNNLAREYEKMNAMAYDTRDSGTFYNNMLLSSSATLGIMASLLVENVAGIALAGLTGGTSEAGALLNSTRAVKAFKTLRDGFKVKNLTQAASEVDDLSRVAKATERINKTSRVADYFSDFSKNLNPLKNTTEFVRDINKNAIPQTQRFKRGFAAVWGDARTANLVYKESALEANLAKNEFVDNEINKFRDENGRMPTGAEIADIQKRASSVRSSVLMGNLAAIYLTDKITFNDLLDPVLTRTLRNGAGRLPENILHDKSGFFVSSWKDWIPGKHFKAKLKNSSGKLIDRSLGSVSEGLQENIQDVLADAAKSYYADTFNTDYGKNSFGEYINFMFNNDYMPQAIRNQISEQGLETFLSGALMGGPVTLVSRSLAGVGNLAMKGVDYRNVNKLKKKMDSLQSLGEDNAEYKKAKREYETAKNRYNYTYANEGANDIVKELNYMWDYTQGGAWMIDRMNHAIDMNNVVGQIYGGLQGESEKDVETTKEMAFEKAFGYALRYGQLDTILDHYNELKQNAGELYKQYGAENEQEFRDNIDKIIEKGNKMAAVWEHYDKKFPTKYHPENYKVGSEEFQQEMLGQFAEKITKQAMVFFNEDYNRMIEYEKQALSALQTAFSEISLDNKVGFTTDAQFLLSADGLKQELENIGKMIRGYEDLGNGITAENKQQLDKLKSKRDALNMLNNALKVSENMNAFNKLTKELNDALKKLDEDENKKQKELEETVKNNPEADVTALDDEIEKIKQERKATEEQIAKTQKTFDEMFTADEFNKFKNGNKEIVNAKVRNGISAYMKWLSKEYGVDYKRLTAKSRNSLFDMLTKLYSNKQRMNTVQEALYGVATERDFIAVTEKVKADLMEVKKNKYNIIFDSLRAFENSKRTNKLLNDLFDAGFWIRPEQLKRMLKDGTMPEIYYVNDFKENVNRADLSGELPVVKTSDDYKKALEIIQKFVDNYNKKNPGKEIHLKGVINYDSNDRPVLAEREANDKRNLNAIKVEYGLDGKNEAKATELLEKIANSQYASKQMKEFANNILNYIKVHPDFDITIKFAENQNIPIIVDGGVITVDLRYCSSEYANNNPYSAEFIMAKAIFSNIAKDMIDKDSQFKKQIQSLYDSAIASVNAVQPGMKVAYHGFDDIYSFVSESMLNSKFQEILSIIKNAETKDYKVTKKSIWERFVDAVLTMVANKLGGIISRDDNNMLNCTVDVITAKLEGGNITPVTQTQQTTTTQQTTKTTSPVPPAGKTALTESNKLFENYQDRFPIATIRDSYKDVTKKLVDDFKRLYDGVYDFTNKSDDDIIKSSQFADYYRSDNAKKILDNNNVTKDFENHQSGFMYRTDEAQELINKVFYRNVDNEDTSVAIKIISFSDENGKQMFKIARFVYGNNKSFQFEIVDVTDKELYDLIGKQDSGYVKLSLDTNQAPDIYQGDKYVNVEVNDDGTYKYTIIEITNAGKDNSTFNIYTIDSNGNELVSTRKETLTNKELQEKLVNGYAWLNDENALPITKQEQPPVEQQQVNKLSDAQIRSNIKRKLRTSLKKLIGDKTLNDFKTLLDSTYTGKYAEQYREWANKPSGFNGLTNIEKLLFDEYYGKFSQDDLNVGVGVAYLDEGKIYAGNIASINNDGTVTIDDAIDGYPRDIKIADIKLVRTPRLEKFLPYIITDNVTTDDLRSIQNVTNKKNDDNYDANNSQITTFANEIEQLTLEQLVKEYSEYRCKY